MDIDRFKVINDLYGLEEGDKLLMPLRICCGKRWPGPTASTDASAGMWFCLCVDYSRERILASSRN